jgi:dipeptidase
VKPDEKVSVQDIIALYRDTMTGTEYDIMLDPAWLVSKRITTYDEEGNRIRTYVDAPSDLCGPEPLGDIFSLIGGEIQSQRLIAIARCSYFFVSQARDWLAYSPFVPVYTGITEVPESWTVVDRDTLDRNSSWWAFGLTTKLVNAQYTAFKPELDELLVPMQEEMYAMQDVIEQAALDLYETDPAAACQFLTNYTCSRMNSAEAAYWDFVDQLLFDF